MTYTTVELARLQDHLQERPMKCKPCRVTVDGTRYEISADGTVRPTWIETPDPMAHTDGGRVYGPQASAEEARRVRAEASRQRRNRNARLRDQAMRDLGMVRTPYGWE